MGYEIFVTPGLGDNSYLVASDEEAVIVDPQRDAWRFLAVAAAKQWRLCYVLKTHVHKTTSRESISGEEAFHEGGIYAI